MFENWRLLKHGHHNPWPLLEAGVYLKSGIYLKFYGTFLQKY